MGPFVAAILGLAGLAAMGRGQQHAGVPYSRRDTIAITHNYAACLAQRARRLVAQALEQVPGSAEEARRIFRLAEGSSECLTEAARPTTSIATLHFPPAAIRGELAEALFRRDFHADGTARVPRDQLARLPDLIEASRRPDLSPASRGSILLGAFAMCVVDNATEAVRRLLGTQPTSPEEAAAFVALNPSFAPCLPAGRQFAMDRPMLRGFLAEGMYRLAVQRLPPI